ncbi:MAG: SPOR domain-containing protein [Rhizomicrobium sp.]
MANFERGSDDVRVFDAAEDEEDVEGSRLPLLIVIALLVLAAFGAVVWLAYQKGVQQGHAEAPRVIAADQGPAKVAPDNAGGTPTPYTGLKIYQQPAPSDADAGNDTAPPSNDAMKPAPVQATPAPPPPKPQSMAMAPAQVPATKPVVAPPAAPKPEPAAVKPAPVEPKPAPTQTAAVTPPPKPAPAPVTAPATAPPTGSGLLQIGSYKSAADANAAWAAYKAKHASLVGGLSSDVQAVDLGAKGTWHRLRIVAGSKAEASALCAKLKAEGGDCLLAK